jgi:hypothetical protein
MFRLHNDHPRSCVVAGVLQSLVRTIYPTKGLPHSIIGLWPHSFHKIMYSAFVWYLLCNRYRMVGSVLWIIKSATPRAQPEGEGLTHFIIHNARAYTMRHLIYILVLIDLCHSNKRLNSSEDLLYRCRVSKTES